MDFGAMGFDSLSPPNHSDRSSIHGSGLVENGSSSKHKWCGGSGFLRPMNEGDEDEARDYKVAKTEPHHYHQQHYQQHMLSFSSPNTQAATFPYYHHQHPSSTPFSRNTGYGSTVVTGMRGPFTPSQWMELEHQALIYKYITANMPIPSYLLNPIRRAFESVGFPALRSNALGWGAFHLGFSSTDPEPGRCRRTDGKKWRCSRDAVADQKYCERHMNRGRHRSRKPVEGQPGNSATGTNAGKLTPSVVPPPAGGLDHRHHLTNLHSRSHLNKESADAAVVLSMMSSKAGLKGHSSSGPEFGLVCSDSLLNPLNRTSYNTINDHEDKSRNALRQFIDERSALFGAQLSISIPPATSDFMSSTSSPTNDKLAVAPSPLRLSHELEMGLGVGSASANQRQVTTNWVPISWEPSMGGPLGEALHATTGECRIAKPLNLMDSWDNSPRPAASSPTGVLQRGAFGSRSNSSAASSPRAESSRALDGGIILMNPSLPPTNCANQLLQLQQ